MKRAFTLIELVVVLAILSVCAGLLFPLLSRPRETVCRATCASNMKQLGLALILYSQDFSERMPPPALNSASASRARLDRPYGWADALFPYTRSIQILHCPRDSRPGSADAARAGFTSYFFNRNLLSRFVGRIARPERALLLGEGSDGRDLSNARYSRSGIEGGWIDDLTSPLHRHDDEHPGTGSFVLFLDGHVKYLTVRPQEPAYFGLQTIR